jgi:cytoskeletal protein CcmA (bactofilin family)
MFQGKITKQNVVNASGSTVVANRVNMGTVIQGNITADTDFRIDGKVLGNIQCTSKVVIGSTGELIGDIECSDLTLEGKVTGNLKVSNVLYFRATAQFEGTVSYQKLIVEEGSDIKGSLTNLEISS